MADDYVDENGRIRWIEEHDLQPTVADPGHDGGEAATQLAALLQRERKRVDASGPRPTGPTPTKPDPSRTFAARPGPR
jgi:hypothetical protein